MQSAAAVKDAKKNTQQACEQQAEATLEGMERCQVTDLGTRIAQKIKAIKPVLKTANVLRPGFCLGDAHAQAKEIVHNLGYSVGATLVGIDKFSKGG